MNVGSGDIEKFASRRNGRWGRLAELLDQYDEHGAPSLGRAGVQELVRLYRLACTDLNQARSMTANPELLGRLNDLVGRAYRAVHRHGGSAGPRPSIAAILLRVVPDTFATERTWVQIAFLALVLGAAFGFAATWLDPTLAHDLIPAQFFTQSPAERVAHIESSPERIGSAGTAAGFAAFLFTHNIQVSFLAFALGALTIVLGWTILAYNGVILGAVAASYVSGGVGTFFIAWVGPHGALELPAIAIAGAAGMRLGDALWFPRGLGRASALRQGAPPALRLLGTAAGLLVVAGLIEGSFSQFSAKTIPYWFKITVAVSLAGGLVLWLRPWKRPLSAPDPAATP